MLKQYLPFFDLPTIFICCGSSVQIVRKTIYSYAQFLKTRGLSTFFSQIKAFYSLNHHLVLHNKFIQFLSVFKKLYTQSTWLIKTTTLNNKLLRSIV